MERIYIIKRYNIWYGFSGQFFEFLKVTYFWLVVAIFNLVQDVKAIFHFP